ncbi:hypothetical protein SCAR479_00046 [Seiridium cardinale]|uniref:Uncharacterized protein n=1 Tax=Seiridium cardinale TaxID=138064 RepID=A0ABR2Y934_9PEZI
MSSNPVLDEAAHDKIATESNIQAAKNHPSHAGVPGSNIDSGKASTGVIDSQPKGQHEEDFKKIAGLEQDQGKQDKIERNIGNADQK